MERTGRDDAAHRLSLLLAKRGSLTDARLRAALSTNRLTPRQATVLTYLEAEPACQQMLVELLECDPSVLVAILNELERAELIYRRRDPSDRRRHIVENEGKSLSRICRIEWNVSATGLEHAQQTHNHLDRALHENADDGLRADVCAS